MSIRIRIADEQMASTPPTTWDERVERVRARGGSGPVRPWDAVVRRVLG